MKIDNPELRLAEEFVQYTDCNIFLTGKAGTGKTTFLHTVRQQTEKRMIVTAPTGVAAINAGGVTLHSFFQLPFGPFIPGGTRKGENRFRMSREKKNIIRSLDLLVIDEISMVRADLLDSVDHVLRQHRRSNLPFGGVQLLMIGDLNQLPPVVKEQEWSLLAEYYDSPYFFSSNALAGTELVPIELKHIYRQSDPEFIDLLNRVRDNRLDAAATARLNNRHIPDFTPQDEDDYITLCTHNNRADSINRKKLDELSTSSIFFQAELDGEFPEHAYPIAADLELKVGAQVMFMRNDPSQEKQYFNGKIGRITSIGDEEICVHCPEDEEAIPVARSSWENIKYTIDPETSEISQEVIGTFAQYPLKPAWAITIHKSQGLTFDRAVIDAQSAFAHGQVYVALSRCRTLEGLVLSSPLSASGIQCDPRLTRFIDHARNNPPTAEQLETARVNYQRKLLLEAFSFARLRAAMGNLVSILKGNAATIHITGGIDIDEVFRATAEEICNVGESFKRQLQGLFREGQLPGSDPVICERLTKAAGYFGEKLTALPVRIITELGAETDNKEISKRIRNGRKWLEEETAAKLAGVQSCTDGFSPPKYLRAVSNAAFDHTGTQKKASSTPTFEESDIEYPELFATLKDWRSAKAKEERLAAFQVMHQKTLIQLSIRMPHTTGDLLKVKGIGKKLAERYGAELVELIAGFRRKHNIAEINLPETTNSDKKETEKDRKAVKVAKGRTRDYSLELFEKGLSITAIAKERRLTPATIEGHLAFWVKNGSLEIERLVTPPRVETIAARLAAMPGATMKEVKEDLPEDFTYREINLVRAHLAREHPAPDATDC